MAYEERYTWEDREDRDERPARRDDMKRKVQKPVTYKYRFQNSPQPQRKPEVHGVQHPKLGEIISTKTGPCKVTEVFWRSATDADVLLRRVETEAAKDAKDAKDAAKKSVTKPVQKKSFPKGKKS